MTEQQNQGPQTILVYSDDRNVRTQARVALGRRVASDLPEIEIVECATHQAVTKAVDAGDIDLLILDAESTPAGGMGVLKMLKAEVANCPPSIMLIARVADAWLATWSEADAVVPMPIDPVRLPTAAAELLRGRLGAQASAQ